MKRTYCVDWWTARGELSGREYDDKGMRYDMEWNTGFTAKRLMWLSKLLTLSITLATNSAGTHQTDVILLMHSLETAKSPKTEDSVR